MKQRMSTAAQNTFIEFPAFLGLPTSGTNGILGCKTKLKTALNKQNA